MREESSSLAEAVKVGLFVTEEEQAFEARVRQLVGTLTGSDEDLRRATVEQVCADQPVLLTWVARGLVAALKSQSLSKRRQAAASLVEIGEPALPALMIPMYDSRAVLFRISLAEVLGRMGPGLAHVESPPGA